jgi:hypothetical protein
MKDVRTYQGIDPATLGRRNKVVIGKHSGLSAILGLCAELNVDIDGCSASSSGVRSSRIGLSGAVMSPGSSKRFAANHGNRLRSPLEWERQHE